MIKRILVADDDENVREILRVYLTKEGCSVTEAVDGIDALRLFEQEKPDLMVLDIMMPGMDGLTVCRKIRETSKLPIILLTAKGEEIDKILGLELGADDYITKPFSPREVVARIKAVLRRVDDKGDDDDEALTFPGLYIDMTNYRVEVDGEFIKCTPREIEVLYYLAKKPGRVFSREELLKKVWGYEYIGESRTVDTHIKRLRKKLNVGDDTICDIKTVWGVGYKFDVKGNGR